MDVPIECPCPGKPHRKTGDTVTLKDKLTFREATTVRKYLQNVKRHEDENLLDAEYSATLSEGYLLVGVESWTLTNGDTQPIPVSPESIREHLLELPVAASIVADQADNLYAEYVLLPLLARASKSSPPRQTNGSTYQKSGSTRKRKTPSKRSSISTTRTAGTAKTRGQPGTVSNGSPS